GDATDATSGVQTVTITLQRPGDNFYWNPATGGSWQAGAVSITTTFTGGVAAGSAGTRTWQTNQALPAAAQWVDGTYNVKSVATDFAGNLETPNAAVALDTDHTTFVVDQTAPSARILSPVHAAVFRAANVPTAISGDAQD